MRLIDVARTAVSGDRVIAAGIFQSSGSLTARMSGFGEFSVRRREREERESSGLHFKRYMLLVVTPSQLHLFDARSALTRWKVGARLATWDRSAVQAQADVMPVTIRLSLEIPSENRHVELEAPKARRSTAGEVARVLAGSSPSPSGVGAPSARRTTGHAVAETAQLREQHKRAGGLAVTGGLVRLLAYSLPWIVVTSTASGRSISISGYEAMGVPILSIGFSIVIIVAGVLYLAGRGEGSPRLVLSLGIGSVLAHLFQFATILDRMGPLRTELQARGLPVTSAVGFGAWVELVGVLLTLAGGVYAFILWKQARPRRGSYVPHRPDIEMSRGPSLPVDLSDATPT